MKKTILYIATSTICLGLMLTNCSKKADPAPAGTTSTTGTTTTGGTTSGTTSSGSTTSATTTGSTTMSTMDINTWKVDNYIDTYVYNGKGGDFKNGSFLTYYRWINMKSPSIKYLDITFKGNDGFPSNGIYKLVSDTIKNMNECKITCISGLSSYNSDSNLNSNILVTNESGILKIEAVDIKATNMYKKTVTISGKLQTNLSTE